MDWQECISPTHFLKLIFWQYEDLRSWSAIMSALLSLLSCKASPWYYSVAPQIWQFQKITNISLLTTPEVHYLSQTECWLLGRALPKEVPGSLGPLLYMSQFLPCKSGHRLIYFWPLSTAWTMPASIFQCLPQASVPSASVSSREFSGLTKWVAWACDFCTSKSCEEETFLGLMA